MAELTDAWLGGAAAAPADAQRLEAALADLVRRARAGLAGVTLADSRFLRSAGAAAATSDPQRIEALQASDLLLAAAALAGEEAALHLLEERFLSLAAGAAAGLDASPAFADEVRQELREKLLVGRDGRPPGLAKYSGAGPLAAYVRISARRLALNLLEARRGAPSSDEDALLGLPAPESDPELQLLRERSAAAIKRAVHEALAGLPVRERLMLRMHYVDGVTMTQIGKVYGVHQSNVSRTLDGARSKVLADVRRLLTDRLRLGDRELDSLVGMVRSGLDLSLSRALRSMS